MGSVKVRACVLRLAYLVVLAMLLEAIGIAASVNPPTLPRHSKARSVTENQHAKRRMRTLARGRVPRSHSAARTASAARTSSPGRTTVRRHRYYERFSTSSFASDMVEGDQTGGEGTVV